MVWIFERVDVEFKVEKKKNDGKATNAKPRKSSSRGRRDFSNTIMKGGV